MRALPAEGGGDGSPVVCAIPADLIGYSRKAILDSEALIGIGRYLQAAIDALNQSGPDSTYLPPVPDLGAQLQRYARAKYQIDEWVGRVGDAFLEANSGMPPNLPVWATQDEIAQALAQDTTRNAQDLAHQLEQALKNDDQQRIQEILAVLQEHQDDPDYNAAFFAALGPLDALQAVSVIAGDHGQLRTFDTALASGTNSINWDESFTNRLLNPESPLSEWVPVPAQHTMVGLMLQFGSFSSDFLNHAGHYLLDHTLYTSDQAGIDFLEALTRCTDPNFALQWLTHVQDGIPWLAGAQQMLYFQGPDLQRALADAIAFAGDPAHDPTHRNRLALYLALAATPSVYVGDPVRGVLASLMASDIGDFREFDGRVPYADAQALFQLAEQDSSGNLVTSRVRALQNALTQWVEQNVPSTDDEARVATYFRDIGTLAGLWAIPQRDSAYSQAAAANSQVGWEFFGVSVLLSIVQAVPVVGQILGTVGNVAVGDVAAYIMGQAQNGVSSGVSSQLDQNLRQLYARTSAAARAVALMEFVRLDPNVVPPVVRHMGSAAVREYLGDLAASQNPVDITVNGVRVFAGPNPPGFEDAMTAYEHLQNLQQQIDQQFLEWAHP